ncbi:MAG: acyl-ACP thioesterase domain-containing protein [Bacteroidales bacterium]
MNEFLHLEKGYHVHVYETGPDGNLNLHSLFNYFQDIASHHAVSLGYGRDDLLRNNTIWVLSRIYAEIASMPAWGTDIVITTWPRGIDRLFALRDYEVRSPEGDLIASATSSWLIVDATTRRIQRPDETLSRFRSEIPEGNALPRNAGKLEPAEAEGSATSPFRVSISDLDINRHTNNVGYLKWVTDSYDLEFILDKVPRSAEINYLAESHYNEEVIIITSGSAGYRNIRNHSVRRTGDSVELCRVQICWDNHN